MLKQHLRPGVSSIWKCWHFALKSSRTILPKIRQQASCQPENQSPPAPFRHRCCCFLSDQQIVPPLALGTEQPNPEEKRLHQHLHQHHLRNEGMVATASPQPAAAVVPKRKEARARPWALGKVFAFV